MIAGPSASAVGSVGTSVTGSYGSINIAANGSYTYTVDNTNATVQALRTSGNTVQEVFTYQVIDTAGLTSLATITVTIQGANDAPVINAATLTLNEGQTVTLSDANFGITDPDDASFTYTITASAGGYFQLSSAAGTAITTFTSANLSAGLVQFVDNGDEIAPSFSVRVSDGSLNSNTLAATINYTGVNEAPTLWVGAGSPVVWVVDGESVGYINVSDLSFTYIGDNIGGLVDVMSNSTGQIWGTTGNSLFQINPLDGSAFNGPLTAQNGWGSASNEDGSKYYLASFNNIWDVNPATGTSTLVNSYAQWTSISGDIEVVGNTAYLATNAGLARIDNFRQGNESVTMLSLSGATTSAWGLASYNGTLYGLTSARTIVSIDPNTGVTTLVASYTSNPNAAQFSGGFFGADNGILPTSNFEATYSENGSAISIVSSQCNVLDTDSSTLQSATIVLINPKTSDGLAINGNAVAANATGTVTGTAISYSVSVDGYTITLSGSDSQANYVTALKAVGFLNGSDAPDTTDRIVTFSVSDGALSSATVSTTIHVVAVNDSPIAAADSATAVEAGGTNNGTAGTNPTGNVLINDTDPDASDTKTVSGVAAGVVGSASSSVGSAVNGTYGSITIAADGSYTYAVENTNSAVQALRTTANTLTDVFTYTMRDAAGLLSTQITITIQGTNDAPVGVNDSATAIEAGGTANGTAGTNPTGNVLTNDTDVDAGDTRTVNGVVAGPSASAVGSVGTSVTGSYGAITINADGSYSYTVDNSNATVQALRISGQTILDVFTYQVADTGGLTSVATITVTIQGANDAPVGVNDTATAVEAGGTANGTAGTNPTGNVLTNDTDVDAGDIKTVSGVVAGPSANAVGSVGASVGGSYGSITINSDGSYTYAVDNTNTAVQALRISGQTLQDVFTYKVSDTDGSTSLATITVTIQGANDAPTAIVDTVTAVEAGGSNNALYSVNPSGNVLTNDTDPDSNANGETKLVTGVVGE